jgi:hypothetical protein
MACFGCKMGDGRGFFATCWFLVLRSGGAGWSRDCDVPRRRNVRDDNNCGSETPSSPSDIRFELPRRPSEITWGIGSDWSGPLPCRVRRLSMIEAPLPMSVDVEG